MRLDPRDFTTAFELGEVYRLLDRVAQAVKAYALACKLQPKNFDPHFRLASCYQQTGDMDQAIEAYREALKVDSRNAKAWSNLGAAYDTKGQYYEAIQAYKRSLECEGEQPVVLVNLATVYMNQDRFDAAQRTLEAAIKLNSGLSLAHERMGYCSWREQKLPDAAASYRKAIELNRRNARAQAGLGVVLMTQYLNDPTQTTLRASAIEAWHQSLEIDSNQPKLRELLDKYRPRADKPALAFE
jgi:superkiller protein 3